MLCGPGGRLAFLRRENLLYRAPPSLLDGLKLRIACSAAMATSEPRRLYRELLQRFIEIDRAGRLPLVACRRIHVGHPDKVIIHNVADEHSLDMGIGDIVEADLAAIVLLDQRAGDVTHPLPPPALYSP